MAEGIIGRAAKKLEQALGVPRPWELYPPASVGYQMATGEGSIGEKARKGLAQSLGRYITNIKEPYGYNIPTMYEMGQKLENVISDEPPWGGGSAATDATQYSPKITSERARDVLYREMFDLPARTMKGSGLTQTGPKQYTLDTGPIAPTPSPRDASQGLTFTGEGKFSKPTKVKYYKQELRENPQWAQTLQFQGTHFPVMRGYNPVYDPESRSLKYSDVWDVVSPAESQEGSGGVASSILRRTAARFLRPATVSGTIPLE